jgi:hypothetical protein
MELARHCIDTPVVASQMVADLNCPKRIAGKGTLSSQVLSKNLARTANMSRKPGNNYAVAY